MRLLDRLRLADRTAKLVATPVEIERLGFGPHPLGDRAGLIERRERLGWSDDIDTVGVVLAVYEGQHLGIGNATAAGTDAELQPTTGDDVDSCCHLCQKRRMTEAVARHDDAEPKASGLRGERREQRPRLEGRAVGIAAKRHHVIPKPRVLEDGHLIRLFPDAKDFFVAEIDLARLDTEGHSTSVHCQRWNASAVCHLERRNVQGPLPQSHRAAASKQRNGRRIEVCPPRGRRSRGRPHRSTCRSLPSSVR